MDENQVVTMIIRMIQRKEHFVFPIWLTFVITWWISYKKDWYVYVGHVNLDRKNYYRVLFEHGSYGNKTNNTVEAAQKSNGTDEKLRSVTKDNGYERK